MSAAMPQARRRRSHADPFAADSPLPLHYPQFDKIKDSDFAPAFDRGMAEQLQGSRGDRQQSGRADLRQHHRRDGEVRPRCSIARTTVFFNLVGTDTNDAREKLRADYAPKFSAHRDAICLNPKLFARIKTLYDARDDARPRRRRQAPGRALLRPTSSAPAPSCPTPTRRG